ncbi:DUF6279 family lipoprotein [Bdellovibrio sp. SKB1291214]|uniref:DUF6279 family lipoprotein n=1 Tax=Bdellovibrio sp. SKB1291214 TaxID=1732569 RepID=UPI000B6EDEF7|nr:DUF6279 family lipoprotein [Bdellovibrio sp. SKB1291214]UYL07338.1 DUF6279 family lipoprotein [Bdellovibrio sp. SKB1291214]
MKNLLLLSILFICGCGAGNPVLDAMVGGMSVTKVESYFNLDEKQEKEFEKNVEHDLKRLKQEQLQEFSKSLRQFDERIPKEKSDSIILSEAFDLLEKEYTRSSGYFKNAAVKLTNTLRDEQFDYFENRVKKEIAESRAQSVQSKNSELKERYRKQILFWVGKMDVHQEQALDQFIRKGQFPWKERLDNRESILNSFMAKRRDSAKLRAMAAQFMTDYDSLRTPEYAQAIQNYETKFKGFLNKFWSSLSSEQKQQMQISLNKQALEIDRFAAISVTDK